MNKEVINKETNITAPEYRCFINVLEKLPSMGLVSSAMEEIIRSAALSAHDKLLENSEINENDIPSDIIEAYQRLTIQQTEY